MIGQAELIDLVVGHHHLELLFFRHAGFHKAGRFSHPQCDHCLIKPVADPDDIILIADDRLQLAVLLQRPLVFLNLLCRVNSDVPAVRLQL